MYIDMRNHSHIRHLGKKLDSPNESIQRNFLNVIVDDYHTFIILSYHTLYVNVLCGKMKRK